MSASPSLYSNQGRKDRSLEFARFARWTIALRGDRFRVRRRIFEREQIAGLAIEHLTESGVPDRMALAPPAIHTRDFTHNDSATDTATSTQGSVRRTAFPRASREN